MDDNIEPEEESLGSSEEPAEVVDDAPKNENSKAEVKKEKPKEVKETIKERIERLKKERSKE